MLVKVICLCGESVRVEVDKVKNALRYREREYGFGDHVSDPRAFVMRYMGCKGWRWRGVPLGKSTITMECPRCRAQVMAMDEDGGNVGGDEANNR
jgi:hypothetical protein